MSRAPVARERLERFHSWLGVGPLTAYMVFHLWQQWPALASPAAWSDRVRATSRSWVLFLVAAFFLAHAGLGWWRWRSRAGDAASGAVPETPDARGLARLQALTGVLGFAFIVYHVWRVGLPGGGLHASAMGAYHALMTSLGTPIETAATIVGVSCLCFHLGHGLARAAEHAGIVQGAAAIRRARLGVGAFGFVLWGAALHLVGHFAIGEGLWAGVLRALAPLIDLGGA